MAVTTLTVQLQQSRHTASTSPLSMVEPGRKGQLCTTWGSSRSRRRRKKRCTWTERQQQEEGQLSSTPPSLWHSAGREGGRSHGPLPLAGGVVIDRLQPHIWHILEKRQMAFLIRMLSFHNSAGIYSFHHETSSSCAKLKLASSSCPVQVVQNLNWLND